MGWGLGFIEDLMGKSNVEAAKNAYNNSRFKKSIDDVSQGAEDIYRDVSYTANAIGDKYNAGKAAYEARIRAEQLADARGLPSPDQEAMQNMDGVFIPAGRVIDKGLTAATKGLGNLFTKAPANTMLTRRSLDDVANMTQDIGDIAVKQVGSNVNRYGQDMTRANWAFDDAAREVAKREGSALAKHSGEIRAANNAAGKRGKEFWADNTPTHTPPSSPKYTNADLDAITKQVGDVQKAKFKAGLVRNEQDARIMNELLKRRPGYEMASDVSDTFRTVGGIRRGLQ